MVTANLMSERRLTIPNNLVTGVLFAIPAYFAGVWVGNLFGLFDDQNTGVILGYVFATAAFLIGIGFLNYPLARIMGWPVTPISDAEPDLGLGRFFRLSLDHKVIGLQYLFTILIMLLLGGIGAMMIRTSLLVPDSTITPPGQYIALIGLHSVMMIFITSAVIVGPFGNYLVPLMIGARRMAFPRLEALSFWLVPPAAVILAVATFWGGFPTGWTGYPPLSEQAGQGMDSYIVGFALIALALVTSGVNMLATIISLRAPGMTWTRLPIFVWGIFTTSILGMLAAPVLAAAIVMLAMDRSVQTSFFLSSNGGSNYLWENLFWFFGHPEVYIFILPAFGIVMEIVPHFARKPLWGYRTAVVGLFGVALLSWFVWQHHLFVSGIAPVLRPFYMLSTELISIPTGVIFLVTLGTLWRARVWFSVPMLFCMGFLFNFLIGGISGVYLSDVPTDVTLHGSYFSMAHFHYTIMGGEIFGLMAAVYYWLPKMTGRMMSQTIGRIQFWWMFIAFNSTFFPLFIIGLLNMPRRVAEYDPALQGLNIWVSVSAFFLFGSMVLFAANLVYSLAFSGRVALRNPWHARSLEWQIPTPVPAHNFERVPVIVGGPYDYGMPDARPVADFGGLKGVTSGA
ncbi:MAG TPA: cbb3-type cytochrome c oxidase subunit I [Candidatus Dormibacteraeota bacterium]|nr:cbb3-type cytochrome c oxidase subunit I [Candidatus Dormibacteraeota bacterium]